MPAGGLSFLYLPAVILGDSSQTLREENMSLLSLHDEALRSIFLLLHGGSFSDTNAELRRDAHARNLASCCKRLDRIYRESVDFLILTKSYGSEGCRRLRGRFPCVSHLEFHNLGTDLDHCSTRPEFATIEIPKQYPSALVRNVIKSISLWGGLFKLGVMKVSVLQAMMKNCTGLE